MRLAWHIEVLQRQQKLPALKKLLIGVSQIEQPQTDGERRAVIDDFRARYGLSAKRVRLVRRPVVH